MKDNEDYETDQISVVELRGKNTIVTYKIDDSLLNLDKPVSSLYWKWEVIVKLPKKRCRSKVFCTVLLGRISNAIVGSDEKKKNPFSETI